MARVKAIKNAAGVTVNDVVMTICTGGLRRYLSMHGELPGEPMQAVVPMSVRSVGDVELGKLLAAGAAVEVVGGGAAAVERAQAYLESTGIADAAYFGPENEFFVFDNVSWDDNMQGAFYKIDSDEGAWNTDRSLEEGNMGHRPTVKGGYFPVPPVDSLHDIRGSMCLALEEMGFTEVEVHAEAAPVAIGDRPPQVGDPPRLGVPVVAGIAHRIRQLLDEKVRPI